MGLRDFIDNMKYGGFKNMVEDFVDMNKEAKDFVVDSKQEVSELMTDGFKEMVIKGKCDYKTSFEKREEAEKIINTSKRKLDSLKINLEYIQKVIDDECRVLKAITDNIETIKGKINYFGRSFK